MRSGTRAYAWSLLGIHLLFLLAQIPLWGYFTDDTYIHLVYARNLLLGRGWVFNVGEPSYGSTSPLWVLLLSPLAGSEAAGLLAARLYALGAGLLAVFFFHRLASRVIVRPSMRLLATLLFATEAWFLRWSASGMESSLAVLALLLLMNALAVSPYGARAVFGIGLLAGAAALIRPEYYVLDLILLGLALFSRRWRRHWWALATGVALLVVPWLLFAHFELGSALPSTAAAKSGGFQGFGHLALQAWRLLKVPLSSQACLLALTAAGCLVAFLGGPTRRPHPGLPAGRFEPRYRFYALVAFFWGLTLPVFYIVRDVQVISRYLLIVTPLLPLGACYWLDLWMDRRPRLKILAPLLLILSLGPNTYLYFSRVLPHARLFPVELEGSLGRIADHLRVYAAPGSKVAAPDIGILGMRSGCGIVDLGGLIHPEIGALWQEQGYRSMVEDLAFLRYREADYLVDRDPVPAVLAGVAPGGHILVPVLQAPVSGLGLRKAEALTYTLYRIGRATGAPATEPSAAAAGERLAP